MSSRKAAAGAARGAKRKPASAKPATRSKRAPAADAFGDLSAAADRLAAGLERALAQGRSDALAEEALQRLMAAVCRAYRAHIDAGRDYLPLPGRSAVAPTDVMVTCGALLRAADLQVFELGMWQSFTGR